MEYNKLASKEVVENVVKALAERNIEAMVVENGAEALAKIKELIPPGASVMNGSSRTLDQIGFVDYLKTGQHDWNNLHAGVLAEKDSAKQKLLRKQAVISDYYLGSVHALSETGEFIITSNTGSQLTHIAFTSPNLIFVVSTKKIVPTLSDAMSRLKEYVFPLENASIMAKYGRPTMISKILTFEGENPSSGRKVRMLLVNEDLGF